MDELRNLIYAIEWNYLAKIIFRLVLAVIAGGLIGNERQRHGRAAGMRTHILVCVGAALTALIGVYLDEMTGTSGDIQRISAQVISGIGFLGAGMIIVKNNNVISGLTTAAGVWTTSIIGIALGYGFYYGAVVATILFMITIVLFTKLEKSKNTTEMIYVEIDNMYKANHVVKEIEAMLDSEITHKMLPAKSGNTNHLGLNIIIDKRRELDVLKLCEIENVVFVEVD